MMSKHRSISDESAVYRFQRLAFDAGLVVLLIGLLQLIPLVAALITGDHVSADAFLASALLAYLLGGSAALGARGGRARHRTDQLILFPFALFAAGSVFGALPFFFLNPDITAGTAFYESVSLITTNGTSAFSTSASFPIAIDLWRGILAWLGGLMALIVVICVLLPLNAGGYRLHISSLILDHGENLEDRVVSALAAILPIYMAISSLCFVLLLITGSGWIEAFLKMCGAVSLTGIANLAWEKRAIVQIIILLTTMLIAALNWDIIAGGRKTAFRRLIKNFETKSLIFAMTLGFITLWLVLTSDPLDRLYHAIMVAVSAVTTTGWYMTVPSHMVNDSVILVGIGLAITGGASLSATGGIKQLRVVALKKIVASELDRLAHPSSVQRKRVGRAILEDADIDSLWLFATLFTGTMVLGVLGLVALGVDLKSAVYIILSHITLAGPLVDGMGNGIEQISALYDDELVFLGAFLLIARVEASILLIIMGRKFWRL